MDQDIVRAVKEQGLRLHPDDILLIGFLNLSDIVSVLGPNNVRFSGSFSFFRTDDDLGAFFDHGSSAVKIEGFIWGKEAKKLAATLIDENEWSPA